MTNPLDTDGADLVECAKAHSSTIGNGARTLKPEHTMSDTFERIPIAISTNAGLLGSFSMSLTHCSGGVCEKLVERLTKYVAIPHDPASSRACMTLCIASYPYRCISLLLLHCLFRYCPIDTLSLYGTLVNGCPVVSML